MSTQKAKIFWSGRSQAVRLPKEFRFDAKEVEISRHGNTIVLKLPQPPTAPGEDEWAWLDTLSGVVDPTFEAAVEEDPGEPTPRPEVDEFFR